jgi:serine/threonine protein kinase
MCWLRKYTANDLYFTCRTAPEALMYNKYTVLSDVWSFGVTLWEIFSYGDGPKYDNLENVAGLSSLLNKGARLKQSKNCPDDVYKNIIMKCWYFEPEKRKNFTELLVILQSFLKAYEGRHE